MSRHRSVSDADILTATLQVMARQGPVKLTLADVARECGLSAPTLIQRFGSKRGLLLAVSQAGTVGIEEAFDELRAAHRSPLATLITAATQMARMSTSAEELANHLAFLQNDLSDPDFHRHTAEMLRRTRAGYRKLLDEAVKAGELERCDTDRLARLVDAVCGGSLLGWAVHREGTAEQFVRRDLEALLAPYRKKRKR